MILCGCNCLVKHSCNCIFHIFNFFLLFDFFLPFSPAVLLFHGIQFNGLLAFLVTMKYDDDDDDGSKTELVYN